MSVVVIQCMAKMELGGAQKRVLELLREIKDKSILITGTGGELYEEVKREFGTRHVVLPCLTREINPLYDIICFFRLRNYLIRLHKKYDRIIIHTHGSKAGVIGRFVSGTLSFVYSVHTVHGFAISPYINFFKRFLYLNAERISSLFGDIIITQSKVHIDRLKEWGMGKSNKLIWIPNSINYSKIGTYSRKKRRKTITIGTVANFKPQKNPFMWVKVAKKVLCKYPETEFIYVGDGPLKKETEKLTGDDNRIKFLGWRKDITEILNNMDIFFLPSKWEGLPRTVLEAMASSLPVVASSVDGTVEAVVESETGYLLNPCNLDGFVERLGELIEDEKKRLKMGSRGRERVEMYFSYDRLINKTLNVYKALGLS